jgi:homeodomain-containing protein
LPRPIPVTQPSGQRSPHISRASRTSGRGQCSPSVLHLSADIILLRLAGLGVEVIAQRLNTTPKRVSLWSHRFETGGLNGLADKPGRGRKPSIPAAKVARVITEATRPPKGRRRWSIRSMSRHAGISASSVQRSSNDLKPLRLKTFKLSNDPAFEAKFWDVIGLYLNPPERALVLCCDEKSQCQALERTQLGLPLAPKRPPTMTHDYVRHGTVTLFAALSQLTGKLITRTDDHAEARPRPWIAGATP